MLSEAPAGFAAASAIISVAAAARRRGFGGGLFVVMSMGVAVVMLMLAMLIMVMMAAMIVVMIMVVRCVIVPRMIMRAVMMRMIVVSLFGSAAGIGAAFRIERRFDLDHPRAQSPHHRFDDVIAPDPQPLTDDLGRQMAVAEMPGDPDQMMRIRDADLEQRFRRRDHFDQPAIVEHQRVAAAQRDGVFKVEQEFQPARSRHRHPPPVTIVEIEHDRIGGRLRPAMLRTDLRGSDHVDLSF
jgi:hypothetical protein